MTYYIRDIQEKDNQEVEYVIRSCLIEFHGDHKGTAWCDPHLGSFYQFYQLEKSHYWVIEDEKGHVVGGAGIGPLCLKDNVCELQKINTTLQNHDRSTPPGHDTLSFGKENEKDV